MKLLYLSFLFLLCSAPAVSFADPIDKVADLIRQGDIHNLSKLFAPSVEITITDQENVYSKVQAELVLSKFFSEHKPHAVKILHKVNSNSNYQFGVVIFNTDKEAFRVTFTMKQTEGSLLLIEMRIETEKVR
jgi:hypothetical protein